MTILFSSHRPDLPPDESILLRLLRRWRVWRLHRQTRKILNKLNDEHLKDIGLKREDIERLYRH
ncbi:hypothetical protein DZA65_00235 [Dickeya dianthicola]|uniref:DUF1127 domain-containing protein n=1 Tax=Dickeya dianthicola TaxID=204039 RepID=A0AAP2CY30_9GAMM|nr:DUF1127 domain-containing protein [Dickeya dianthicola]AYC17154.1 hypothetical protein DZA65_00235 [Dickeya dianthicola]MBI0439317.1 DUF1127 domain-containing protein [Dickeya dianthicola]MBI0450539.1 DUF1127 domain-containing protein [Dickeya dianthicola]MBI0455111.1 DUF1127 domain-containing protein [Dickeya dianthicola]MBI0458362.1 DUF1127 domain-containing protein [Dickeya dianthicola]